MIAQELEVSLHMAFMDARQKRHEFITVEHLLLAMLDNPTAAEVMRACAVDVDELRKQLTEFIRADQRQDYLRRSSSPSSSESTRRCWPATTWIPSPRSASSE